MIIGRRRWSWDHGYGHHTTNTDDDVMVWYHRSSSHHPIMVRRRKILRDYRYIMVVSRTLWTCDSSCRHYSPSRVMVGRLMFQIAVITRWLWCELRTKFCHDLSDNLIEDVHCQTIDPVRWPGVDFGWNDSMQSISFDKQTSIIN